MSEKEPALLTAESATRALSLSLRAESCFGLREEWQMHEALRSIASGAVICKSAAAEREMQDRLAGYERQIAGQLETLIRQEELRGEDRAEILHLKVLLRDLYQAMSWDCDENWHGDLKDRVEAAFK